MFKNKNLFLLIIIILLTITYILSFSKNKTGKDYRKQIQTELINEKNQKNIIMFQIKQGNDLLTLFKNDDIWCVQKDTASSAIIPADQKKISAFINNLVSLRNVYKISDKLSANNDFGLNDNNTIVIRYYLEDDSFYDLIFGGKDFALTNRYFMTGKSLAVYEIDDSFDQFLSLSVQNWADPYIISKSVLGDINEKDIQNIFVNYNSVKTILNNSNVNEFFTKMNKLLELRHGGFSLSTNKTNLQETLEIKIEFGNKEWVTITTTGYSQIDNDYYLDVYYYIETINKGYHFNCKVSQWTYNRIKEIIL